jgi:acyl-CoA thioesterase FadM
MEEVRDEWLVELLCERSIGDIVLARVAIDYRRELTQRDDVVVARCRVERIGNSSVRTHEEVRRRDGVLAAEAEVVLVARDLGAGGSRALTAEERAAFERDLAADDG